MPSFELAETQLQSSSATQPSRLLQATKCVPTATIVGTVGTPSTSAGNASTRIKIANQSEMRHKCRPLSPRLQWIGAVLNPFDRATRDALNQVNHGGGMDMRLISPDCDVIFATNLATQFVIALTSRLQLRQHFVTLRRSRDYSTVEDYLTEYIQAGTVFGTLASDICLDTGCSQTLVHSSLVPPDHLIDETIDIRCAHGDIVSSPGAIVSICIDAEQYSVRVGVSDTLRIQSCLAQSFQVSFATCRMTTLLTPLQ